MTIDIHKVITSNPITKNILSPWGSNSKANSIRGKLFNKYTGPGNNLSKQVKFNPKTGKIIQIYDHVCTKANLTLKNSYEMMQELKIELNNKIISNEYNTNYSYIINHILENSKNDDLIYRNIDIHQNVVKYNDTNKDIYLTKNGDTMQVTCNEFLKIFQTFSKI